MRNISQDINLTYMHKDTRKKTLYDILRMINREKIRKPITTMEFPTTESFKYAIESLGQWQHDSQTVQLHPGDIGWFSRFGEQKTLEAIRHWKHNGKIIAIGLIDGDNLIRIGIDPSLTKDENIADQIANDINSMTNITSVEARSAETLRQKLSASGWDNGDIWTSLSITKGQPIDSSKQRVEIVNDDNIKDRVKVQRASFDNSTFTTDSWRNMANSDIYKNYGQCLILYNNENEPVASATVWASGSGKPGLIEPLGVHRDHRGMGFGKEITLAAARSLFEIGASSVSVCTDSNNVAAVNTYKSAGFFELPEVCDLTRQ